MTKKLLVFDSHPVQYRVPIWQEIEKILPFSIHVAYASDCSIKGHVDTGFSQTIAWDEPLLSGYANSILNSEEGVPLSGRNSLTGKGISEKIKEIKPDYILLTGLNYKFDSVAYKLAKKNNIPVWLRCETQDEATDRSAFKNVIRKLIYKRLYKGFSSFFYIGELNKKHYLLHGVSANKLFAGLYGTVNRYKELDIEQKKSIRNAIRFENGIMPENYVVGFSGKFIYKKNPDILFQMLDTLSSELRKKLVLYFLGSGELEHTLKNLADKALEKYGVKSIFTGFVNQSTIGNHYLAMDVLVLPSRKMGETWGLVANEALQAGCGLVVSDAVGSSKNFGKWERVRIFKVGDHETLSQKLFELSKFKTDLSWATNLLEPYSIETTARAIVSHLA